MTIQRESLNKFTLSIFAPLLIFVGVGGFVLPKSVSLTSGAPAYNVFHICFGLLGLAVLWSKKEWFISLFNGGFGLIDLYQAFASFADLPPKQYFLWTWVDDILHIVIGLALFIISCYGIIRLRK